MNRFCLVALLLLTFIAPAQPADSAGVMARTGSAGDQPAAAGAVTYRPYKSFSLPAGAGQPWGISAVGATHVGQGDLFFAAGADKIFRITASEQITPYVTLASPAPAGQMLIAAAPDNSLWFTYSPMRIGRVSGSKDVTYHNLKTTNVSVSGITVDSYGNAWFLETGDLVTGGTPTPSRIGRLTPGGDLTDFVVPTNNHLGGIAIGPDGNIWFTEHNAYPQFYNNPSKIGMLNATAGTFVEFELSASSGVPWEITADRDGALWFVETSNAVDGQRIGRITTTGEIAEYPVPNAQGTVLYGIAAAPDGALYFLRRESGGTGALAKVTTRGEFSNPLPPATTVGGTGQLAIGPNGNIWFTDTTLSKVGRLGTAFLPSMDGYSFNNGWDSPARVDDDFTPDDMRKMFGDTFVCGLTNPCQYSPIANWYRETILDVLINGGHCVGLAVTSLRLYRGLDLASDLQDGAKITPDLKINLVDNHDVGKYVCQYITYYAALGQAPVLKTLNRFGYLADTPSDVVIRLIQGTPTSSDPMVLLLWDYAGGIGHAVVPYKVQDMGNGLYWIYVYENQLQGSDPKAEDSKIVIDTVLNTWSYSDEGIQGGDAHSNSITAVPLSKFDVTPEVPFAAFTAKTRAASLLSAAAVDLRLTGPGHLLTTNSQNQRLGYVGNQFVREISGAYGLPPFAGPHNPHEPIYSLPTGEPYTTFLSGESLTRTGTSSVHQLSGDHGASVEGIAIQPSTRDVVRFGLENNQIEYMPTETKPLTMTLVGTSPFNDRFDIQKLTVGAGTTFSAAVDSASGRIAIGGRKSGDGTFTLQYARQDALQSVTFLRRDIVIKATDTLFVRYADWRGTGSMILDIDHGSDGTIDETVTLENQAIPSKPPFRSTESVLTSPTWCVNGCDLDHSFGSSIAISGDTMAVGAASGNTAAHVEIYRRSGGTWTFEKKIQIPIPRYYTGLDLALDGNTLVVPSWDSGDTATYVYERQTDGSWPLVSTLPFYAQAVAIKGNTIALGNPAWVQVYVRNGGSWSLAQVIPDEDPSDDRGWTRLTLSNDTLVVGRRCCNGLSPWVPGAVWVYVKNGGAWTLQQKLIPADPELKSDFGSVLSIQGETLVVSGLPTSNCGGCYRTGNHGQIWVFRRSGSIWKEVQRISGPVPYDSSKLINTYYGGTMAFQGDWLAVGMLYENGQSYSSGAVYLYQRTNDTFELWGRLTPSDGWKVSPQNSMAATCFGGRSLAIDSKAVFVGADCAPREVYPGAGKIYTYTEIGYGEAAGKSTVLVPMAVR